MISGSWALDGLREPFYLTISGRALCKNGQLEEGKTRFARLQNRAPNGNVAFHNWAIYNTVQYDVENTIRNLRLAIDKSDKDRSFLEQEASFDFIREASAFQELLKEM